MTLLQSSYLDTSVNEALGRIEAEYREMPGLTLTLRQAQRLWGLDSVTCQTALSALTRRRFLRRAADGAYVRDRPA
jgi:predicted transcriptional regulator of viral defense system